MSSRAKAGTAALQTCLGLVAADYIKYGMAIGADTAQGAPADALEYTAAAGGAAYVVGKNHVIAEIEDTYSFTTDTFDFWRRERPTISEARREIHRRARIFQTRLSRGKRITSQDT